MDCKCSECMMHVDWAEGADGPTEWVPAKLLADRDAEIDAELGPAKVGGLTRPAVRVAAESSSMRGSNSRRAVAMAGVNRVPSAVRAA